MASWTSPPASMLTFSADPAEVIALASTCSSRSSCVINVASATPTG
jgi:hypothetical protein